MLVIDAENAVLGRLASKVAKALLNGEQVVIINAEKALISGNKEYIIRKYKTRRNLQTKQNPEKSPKWPKVPNLLLRRIIRGMLPRKKAKGRQAFKRLKVYIGNPLNVQGTKVDEAMKELKNYITMADLCSYLGWKG
ncbi:MAG: 50S ribosomal protein L13 [Candidatus Anstonellales archaeon]